MKTRTRTLVATALVLGIAAGPVAAAQAAPAPAPVPASASASVPSPVFSAPPDAAALRKAIEGVGPQNKDATAALVRVSGTSGSWRGSAGVADVRSGRAAVEDARFRAGSVTKTFTAAVVLQLAAEGRVDLDRPVQDYLPGLLPGFEPVKVRQLLDYTSGLQSADGPGDAFEDEYAHRFDLVDPHALIANAVAKGPEFRPGKKQRYSNIHYTVLGVLIEKLTGTTYEKAVGDRIIKPLGLHHTSFPSRTQNRIPGPYNHGYQAVRQADGSRSLVDVSDWNSSSNWAAGDLISTTTDLERFTTALFGGRVVPRAQLEEMFTVPDVPDAESKTGEHAVQTAGLKEFTLPGGTKLYGKTGSRYGYSTVIGGTRDLSRTLVYSVNSTDAKGRDMNAVAYGIIGAAFAK
ncbi:D-alanyl-D-alanine carboxypeptidase [Streptomyces sp. 3211.6]|uniref:serine hydrolase domain-containing protein n=1 Tax=Streptomyces sp. 3211.6 TaxID=1938845 RepID=UPI000EAE31F0|nr:serine hydrolase domain-containing protein [Streptomyces sp. 3211.6]RKT07196.1 D-alanyl-D-alanine carboxypeptidase [Streptomyces sp. 3211.6]